MKNLEIRITGSGTKNQIEMSLITIVRELQTIDDYDLDKLNTIAPFFEDATLCAEITED